MSTESKREIENELLAYKQRRHGQLGAPLDLHPATRKMLQSEVARTASRPLLTSEEAAKNFARSFAMSHQRPSFFARHRPQVIWGGTLFACLTIVLAVLRNDPQQTARQRAFPDPLPAPPVTPTAPPSPAKMPAAAKPQRELEHLARDAKSERKLDTLPELAKAPATPAPVALRNVAPTSGPMPTGQTEAMRRNAGGAGPAPTVRSSAALADAKEPLANRAFVKAPTPAPRSPVIEADRLLREQVAPAEPAGVVKVLKSAPAAGGALVPSTKTTDAEVALKQSGELKRVPLALAKDADAAKPHFTAPAAAASQRFQQLDQRAGYRPNFNSPPLPQVMQDFAFERTGDRVRIVDADGSTYEGTVTGAAAAELRATPTLADTAARKAANEQKGQAVDVQVAYRFLARGVSRKLNQTVEFRGEWQPASPAPAPAAMPALLPTSFGVARADGQAAEKKDQSSVAIGFVSNGAPAQTVGQLQQGLRELPAGRISGRAVVGGKNEFDINAVPK